MKLMFFFFSGKVGKPSWLAIFTNGYMQITSDLRVEGKLQYHVINYISIDSSILHTTNKQITPTFQISPHLTPFLQKCTKISHQEKKVVGSLVHQGVPEGKDVPGAMGCQAS